MVDAEDVVVVVVAPADVGNGFGKKTKIATSREIWWLFLVVFSINFRLSSKNNAPHDRGAIHHIVKVFRKANH